MRKPDELRASGAATPVERSPAEREAVLAELESILSDIAFRRSQRCVALLRTMVGHALAGDQEGIKERTLGIEVFGREHDYDSNADPIVRMVANEIRKRLAQYYQDNDARHRVRIRLVAGSYIPEFELLPDPSASDPGRNDVRENRPEPPAQALTPEPLPIPAEKPRAIRARHRYAAAFAVLLLTAAVVALSLGRSTLFPTAQSLVWKPLLESREPILICVADNSALEMKGLGELTDQQKQSQLQRIADMIESRRAPTIADPANFDPTTPFSDASAAHDITIWLEDRGHSSILRPSSTLALPDLRNRPIVLIGGFDNPWTVILLSDLRFSPRVDPATGTFWIRDARDPARRDWARHVFEERQVSFDYAVITRNFDKETGSWVLAIAGLGPHGTDAARELLMDSEFARYLPRDLRSTGNFQIVVGTKVINGNTGTPQVVASYTW